MASLSISPIRQAPQPVSAPPPTQFQPVQPPIQPQPQAVPQPQPQLREPLTAPQPTRGVPQMTPGMWSPEMGIRFGPSGSGTQQQSHPQTWDPTKGVKFS